MLRQKTEHRSWHQINFRTTSSLLAAEFLHGLYQRHDPFLNPTRFCNTIVLFRPWNSTSFAPAVEWDLLGVRFGGRFLRDQERLEVELNRVLSNPRSRSRSLAEHLDKLELNSLSDLQVMDLLLETHHVPLGEIYEVNLVQVEHALHCAIRQRLRENCGFDDESVEEVLAELCKSSEPTRAGIEEQDFLRYVLACQERRIASPEEVEHELVQFVRQHQELGAAYGAETVTLEGVKHRFKEFMNLPKEKLSERLELHSKPEIYRRAALEKVKSHRQTEQLVSMLRRVGEVRDSNKHLLGKITKHRGELLEQVSIRRDIESESTRLYLLEELMRLLEDNLEVPETIIRKRREVGVILSRREQLDWLEADTSPKFLQDYDRTGELRGLCASPGTYQGTVRIISSAADLTRLKIGDVLVAEGTDFDLAMLLQMGGAIVTEEGGLLSHAAVLARELNIPCIIDVPNATRKLNDGDEVYLDAGNGSVRVIPPHAAPGSSDTNTSPRSALAGLELTPIDKATNPEEFGKKAASLALLYRHGFRIPQGLMVLSISQCRNIAEHFANGDSSKLEHTAAALSEIFKETRINLRSSSPHEDGSGGSAAGIYWSAIGIQSAPDKIGDALLQVVESASAAAALAYDSQISRTSVAEMAVIVGPYCQFSFQGLALSQSPWDTGRILIEYFESDGVNGCPDGGGTIVQIPRARIIDETSTNSGIKHLASDLFRLAQLAVKLEHIFAELVEIEWGLQHHDLILLQVRPVVNKNKTS